MPKDKRVKGCPNTLCVSNHEKHKYDASDSYCTKCGTELVFVCKNCFKKLSDEGPEHVICRQCEAEREDRKHNSQKRWGHIGENIGNAAKTVGTGISDAAKTVGSGISDVAKSTAKAAESAYQKVTKKSDKSGDHKEPENSKATLQE